MMNFSQTRERLAARKEGENAIEHRDGRTAVTKNVSMGKLSCSGKFIVVWYFSTLTFVRGNAAETEGSYGETGTRKLLSIGVNGRAGNRQL